MFFDISPFQCQPWRRRRGKPSLLGETRRGAACGAGWSGHRRGIAAPAWGKHGANQSTGGKPRTLRPRAAMPERLTPRRPFLSLSSLSLYSCPLPQPSAACDDNPRTGRQSMVDQWICTRWTPPPPYQLFSAILKLKIKKRQLTVVICRRVSSAYRGTSTTYLTDEPPGPTKFSP